MAFVWFLIIGLVAGFLAGTLMKGRGFGLVGNLVVGVIGALLGGWLFGVLGISAGGLVGSLVTATVGAVVLLFLIGLIKKWLQPSGRLLAGAVRSGRAGAAADLAGVSAESGEGRLPRWEAARASWAVLNVHSEGAGVRRLSMSSAWAVYTHTVAGLAATLTPPPPSTTTAAGRHHVSVFVS